MKGYKTSKDYEHLMELLDNGYTIVFFRIDGFPSLAKKDSDGYVFYQCGLASNEFDLKVLCYKNEVEFIEPTD